VGGGSSELALAQQGRPTWLTSLPLGSSKVHTHYAFANPPSCRDLARAREDLATSLQNVAVPFLPRALIVTGSSALALLQVAQRAFQLDEQHCILTRDDLLRCEGMLCTLSARTVAQRYKQELKRCLILPGGALVIRSFLERLQRDAFYVSSYGVREGLLLAYARYGDEWLHHPDISGEAGSQKTQEKIPQEIQQEGPSFIDAGREALSKRAGKMLKWRDKVLQHDDIEDVHKMRVASRRLRATMDAYEACCKPKPFKKVYQEVKDLASVLGTVRDTDVMIAHLQQWAEGMPEAEHDGVGWLVERLQAYHQKRLRVMDEEIQSLKGGSLRQRIVASIQK
jgi:exopolyphosphatase/pppGpp-phosphohydrolase